MENKLSLTHTSVGGVQKICKCVNGGKAVFKRIKSKHSCELNKYEPFI